MWAKYITFLILNVDTKAAAKYLQRICKVGWEYVLCVEGSD